MSYLVLDVDLDTLHSLEKADDQRRVGQVRLVQRGLPKSIGGIHI